MNCLENKSRAQEKIDNSAPEGNVHDKSDYKAKKIIQLLRERAECTTKEGAEYLGLKAPRKRQIRNELAEKGIIIAEGNNRNRKYKISD